MAIYQIRSKRNLTNSVSSNLSHDLKNQYHTRSSSVIKGDTVKIIRGEYKGVEGKVEKINTEKGRLSIEGVQREKIKGGQVKVQIHASNVQITSLKLDDDFRKNSLENRGQTTRSQKSSKKKSDKK
jgi:large subunit ribosomal protein L24